MKTLTREEEIKLAVNVAIVKRAIGDTIPTQKELREFATIQAENAGIADVELFIRHCECEITFQMEIGTPIEFPISA